MNPDIVQLMGSVTCESISSTPQAVVTSLAEMFHGHADFLNLPLYIPNDYVRETLCNDANNSVILKREFSAIR